MKNRILNTAMFICVVTVSGCTNLPKWKMPEFMNWQGSDANVVTQGSKQTPAAKEEPSTPQSVEKEPVIKETGPGSTVLSVTDNIRLNARTTKMMAHRALPPVITARTIKLDTRYAMSFEQIVRRLSDALKHNVTIEERAAREVSRATTLPKPRQFSVSHTGPARELLDDLAANSGYEWELKEGQGGTGEVVFFRYHDLDQVAAIDPSYKGWKVDPKRHKDLKAVLHDWAKKADWSLVWNAGEVNYKVTAHAAFSGDFPEAVDAILSDTKRKQLLVPTAYLQNRYMIINKQ